MGARWAAFGCMVAAFVAMVAIAPVNAAQEMPAELSDQIEMVMGAADSPGGLGDIFSDNPEYAVQIAAAAVSLRPDLAVDIGAIAGAAVPDHAPAIAAILAEAAPGQATAIAVAIVQATQAEWAVEIYEAMMRALPDQAVELAIAISSAAPSMAGPILALLGSSSDNNGRPPRSEPPRILIGTTESSEVVSPSTY